jgi:hypothetical protein
MLQTVMLGMIARTLMKDAHGDLIQQAGMQSHAVSQIYPVRVQPFTSPLAVQSDLYSLMMSVVGRPEVLCSRCVHAAVGSYLKSSPYFRLAQAILAFFAAIAMAARQ